MKKLMMLAATLVVLSGSSAFAAGDANASSNCDPQAKVNGGCHNDVAAAPDCPLHAGGSLFKKTAAVDAPAAQTSTSSQTVVH